MVRPKTPGESCRIRAYSAEHRPMCRIGPKIGRNWTEIGRNWGGVPDKAFRKSCPESSPRRPPNSCGTESCRRTPESGESSAQAVTQVREHGKRFTRSEQVPRNDPQRRWGRSAGIQELLGEFSASSGICGKISTGWETSSNRWEKVPDKASRKGCLESPQWRCERSAGLQGRSRRAPEYSERYAEVASTDAQRRHPCMLRSFVCGTFRVAPAWPNG